MGDSRKPYCAPDGARLRDDRQRHRRRARRGPGPRHRSLDPGIGVLRELGPLARDPRRPGRRHPRAGAVWFSHGHPDHLNPASLPCFRDTRILLPDHVGGRIADDLTRDGYRVEVLPDQTWVRISDRVRVLCIADEGQDAVLLIDVGGRLVVNLNDAQDRGWGSLVKRVIRAFPRIVPPPAQRLRRRRHDQLRRRGRRARPEPGAAPAGEWLRGRRRRRPHDRDVRREPLRALQLVPPLPADRQRVGERLDHADRRVRARVPFRSGRAPPRVRAVRRRRRHRGKGSIRRRRPTSRSRPRSSATTGPTGSTATDVVELARYFGTVERLARAIDRIVFRVGGDDHVVELGGRDTGRAITFAVPRAFVDARGRVGDLRRPAHRELHAHHVARSVAVLGALSRLHALRHQVRRQRTCPHRRRAPRVLRGVPAPPRCHHLVAQRGRAARRRTVCAARVAADSPLYRTAKQLYTRAKRAG